MAEFFDTPAVDGEHIVYQFEVPNAVYRRDRSHIAQHSLGRPQTETAAEEIVGGTKRARKRTTAAQFQGGSGGAL
jgi:hypothetical protein